VSPLRACFLLLALAAAEVALACLLSLLGAPFGFG
jgi:hypothetical protein